MKSNHAYATLVAGVLAALLGTGCDWSSTYVLISPSGGVILFGTRWEVTEVDGVAATVTPPADLGFETAQRIAGSSGCNRYVAELNASQTTVRIGSVAGTRMVCEPRVMEQERRFINALEFTTTQVVDGDTMRFLNGTGRILIRFRRVNATGIQ
jgi:heat shock protein HslJ